MLDYFNSLKESIILSIKKHKVYFFVFLSCILILLIISIIATINYFNYFNIRNLPDKILISYLNDNISLFSFFLKRFFEYLFILLILYLFSFNKFSAFLNILLCGFIVINFVFNFVILISLFGFFGLFHAILTTLICGLIFLCLIFFFSLFFYSFSCECSCAKDYFKNFKTYSFVLILSLVIIFALCVFEIIFIPFTTSTFVVVF